MSTRAGAVAVLVTIAGAASLLAFLRNTGADHAASADGSRLRFSAIVVGDTGKRHHWLPSLLEGQLVVAKGMRDEDRRHPIDAVLFLGDNFYMRGLESYELIERIEMNLVGPYCRFLSLDGPRSRELRTSCRPRRERSRAPSIFAVLGNHDRISSESPGLQRDVLPAFVPNWTVPKQNPLLVEVAPGLSLVFVDAAGGFGADDATALRAALARARGPFRAIVAHRPIAVDEDGGPIRAHSLSEALAAEVPRGLLVHLYLSGHHHSLQLLELPPPAPRLHVIAGSGSRVRRIEASHPNRFFAAERLGFARLDLVDSPEGLRVVVSLFGVAPFPFAARARPELLARHSIDAAGRVTPAPERSAQDR